MYSNYIHLVDKKGTGVAGGNSVAFAWLARDLTDELADTGNLCALAANQFTLLAGTYKCLISDPIFRPAAHQLRLYNITDAAMELLGVSAWNENGGPSAVTRSFIMGRFTIAGAKVFEVQYRVAVAFGGMGLGQTVTWGDNIYTIAELWQETP